MLLDIAENVIVEKKIVRKKNLHRDHITYPRWVLQSKNFAAQFFIEKYLSFRGGDSATPLLAKCLY